MDYDGDTLVGEETTASVASQGFGNQGARRGAAPNRRSPGNPGSPGDVRGGGIALAALSMLPPLSPFFPLTDDPMPAFGGLVPSGTPSTSTPQSEVSRGLAPYLENAANAANPTAPTAPGASGSAVFHTAADSLLAALLNRRQSSGNPYTTYGFGPGGYYTQASINTATGQRLYFVYRPTGLLIGVVDGNGNFVWQNGEGAGDAFGNGIVGAPTPMIGPGTYQGGTGLQNNPNGGLNGTVNPGSGDTSIDDDGTGGLGGLGNRLRFGWAGLQKTKEFLPGSEARRNASGLIKGIPLVGAAYAGYTGATGHDPAAGACESPSERIWDGVNAAGGLVDAAGVGEEAGAVGAGRFPRRIKPEQEASAIKKITNAIKDHLKPGPLGDLNGVTTEQLGGVIINNKTGLPFDHITEMQATLNSLRNNAKILKDSPNADAQTAYQAAQRAIQEIEGALHGLGI